jgi:hypothetical protein
MSIGMMMVVGMMIFTATMGLMPGFMTACVEEVKAFKRGRQIQKQIRGY